MYVGRGGFGGAAVLTAACDDAWSARIIPGVKRGAAVEGWPAVGSASGGGGDGGDRLGDDARGGLADGEVAVSGSGFGVVGGADTGTDLAEGGCIDGRD